MKRWMGVALLVCATVAHAQSSPAKKELVAKLIQLQTPSIEIISRNMVERPVAQMMQAVVQALQTQIPPEKREPVGRAIEADMKKYVDDAVPVARDRALKLAPGTIGPTLEEKFSEDELKQLIAWFESPVNRKYQQFGAEMQGPFSQKLLAEVAPLLDPKLQALQQKIRASLTAAVTDARAGAASAPSPSAKPVAPAAKPAPKATTK